MCWSASVSIAMVGLGAAATAVTARRGEPRAIWMTLGYFTVMEALQAAGYAVVDQCGSPANQSITLLSYLHIVFQPFAVNAFAMAIIAAPPSARARRWVWLFCALSAAVMLAQLVPVERLGQCRPGTILCGEAFCLTSGDWHIAWDIPYNGLFNPLADLLGYPVNFPTYLLTVFVMPLFYGAWRMVLFHALFGPILASLLTTNPNEMPAIWCLLSIGLILVGISPLIRQKVMGTRPKTP